MGDEVNVEGFVVLTLDVVISVITARLESLMWYFGIAFALGILLWTSLMARDKVQERRKREDRGPADDSRPVESVTGEDSGS